MLEHQIAVEEPGQKWFASYHEDCYIIASQHRVNADTIAFDLSICSEPCLVYIRRYLLHGPTCMGQILVPNLMRLVTGPTAPQG